MKFEIKFYGEDGEVSFPPGTTKEQILQELVNVSFSRYPQGLGVYDMEGDHIGNLCPCYPDADNIRILQDTFLPRQTNTLVIHNVDLHELECQRMELLRITMDDSILSTMDEKQQDALQGLLHMLDAWSDAKYDGR
jgi:hypothetical protein